MERVNLAQLNSALTGRESSLQKSLSGEDLSVLLAEMDALTRRYPSQDQEESIEAYQQDLEALAVKHSIATVVSAMRELRLKPGQKFFPRPDEVAEEIELQSERKRVPTAADTKARLAQYESDFWEWVRSRMQDEDTRGMKLQEFLDTVKTVGYVGRRAEDCPFADMRGDAA